ncbi:MAG: Sapep family Mn(2+)-dependent dipeptidase [Bacilli bacterium]
MEETKNILKTLVSYNSIKEKEEEGAPFGKSNKECLEKALEIGKNLGFKTKNLDGYCGYMEIGEGKDIIGIVGHLDIVPAGTGWDTPPFTLTEKNGYLYGRGTTDDKGPVAASITALKEINESGLKLNKRIRLILGCDEENGSACIKHYNEVEEPVTIGFTPDGEFPCIHGEKGMLFGTITSKETNIIDIKGGTVSNAVPSNCKLEIKNKSINTNQFKNFTEKNGLTCQITENENIVIEVNGISAHASTPELGINAISYALVGLKEAGYKDSFVDMFYNYINTSTDGSKAGLNITDDFGDLTLNIGLIEKKENIIVTFDIRFPVTKKSSEIKISLNTNLIPYTKFDEVEEPLFYELDSKLVKTLMESYKSIMNDNLKPIVIGGGTYAKAMPNIIAFGSEFPNNHNNMHNANESAKISDIELQIKLYKKAIEKLLEV